MTVRLVESEQPAEPPGYDRERLESGAERALRALGESDSELSLRLVDDAEIAELNRRWRGREGPTDVLAFSLLEGEHAGHRGALLGDVVIGLAVAERQAGELGHGLDDELERLMIHGLLHLLGHDHQQPDETRRMRAEEQRLREELAS